MGDGKLLNARKTNWLLGRSLTVPAGRPCPMYRSELELVTKAAVVVAVMPVIVLGDTTAGAVEKLERVALADEAVEEV